MPARSAAVVPAGSTAAFPLEGPLVVRRRPRMARVSATGGVREAYADHLRQRYGDRGPEWSHYVGVAARIDAGDEVVVRGWMVRPWLRVDPWAYLRLELDGSATLVEPVRCGPQIVGWEPVGVC